jgi:hypothetical protein
MGKRTELAGRFVVQWPARTAMTGSSCPRAYLIAGSRTLGSGLERDVAYPYGRAVNR